MGRVRNLTSRRFVLSRVRNYPPSSTREAAIPGRASKRPRMHGGSAGRHKRRRTPRRDGRVRRPDPGRAWAQKGAQGTWRTGAPSGGIWRPRGGPPLRRRHAARRDTTHLHDRLWSTQVAAIPYRAAPGGFRAPRIPSPAYRLWEIALPRARVDGGNRGSEPMAAPTPPLGNGRSPIEY